MRTDTQSVTIAAPADRTFEFLADPANLPRWLCRFDPGHPLAAKVQVCVQQFGRREQEVVLMT